MHGHPTVPHARVVVDGVDVRSDLARHGIPEAALMGAVIREQTQRSRLRSACMVLLGATLACAAWLMVEVVLAVGGG